MHRDKRINTLLIFDFNTARGFNLPAQQAGDGDGDGDGVRISDLAS